MEDQMSEPKHVKNWLYPVMKEIFIKFLVHKHNKPYKDIAISEMTESEIELWQQVEAMNGTKVGVTFKTDPEKRVLH